MSTIKETVLAAKEPLDKMLTEEITAEKIGKFSTSIDRTLYVITTLRNTVADAGQKDSDLYKFLQESWQTINDLIDARNIATTKYDLSIDFITSKYEEGSLKLDTEVEETFYEEHEYSGARFHCAEVLEEIRERCDEVAD